MSADHNAGLPYDPSLFAELLSLVSSGEDDIVTLIVSYFDESYSDEIMCVGGYSFTARKAKLLNKSWSKMLAKYGLSYFHMAACNSHKPPYDHLSDGDRIKVATDAIALISMYAAAGFAVTVDKKSFEDIVTRRGIVSSPYELCVWMCLAAVRSEIVKFYPNSSFSFFFETGSDDERSSNKVMNNIFSSPELKAYYSYVSHTFIDKKSCGPIQTADIIAWHWRKDHDRKKENRISYRGDMQALLEGTPHWKIHLGEAQLQGLVNDINKKAGSPYGNEIAGLAAREPNSPIFRKEGQEVGSITAFEKLKAKLGPR